MKAAEFMIGNANAFAVSNLLVLSIAAPMTLAYLTTPLLGLVDTMVVGRMGDAALVGGLAAGAIIFDVLFASFSFLRTGTTGLVAQTFGSRDALEERAVLWRAFSLAVLSGAALILLSPLLVAAGEWFMSAEPAVTRAMDTYIRIRLISAPFALANYVVLGHLIGRGEAGLALFLQIVLNSVNIVLSIWLGLHLGWGVAGVAWATVCGEVVVALMGMANLLQRFQGLPRTSRRHVLDRAALRRMLAFNGDIMIRSFVLMAAFALLARQGAQMGTLVLAANAVLMHFLFISGFFLDGFAAAAEQLAGRAVGARYRPAFDLAVRFTTIWGFALAGLCSLAALLFGEHLVALITTSADVRAEAAVYLPWASLTALSGVLAFQMDGVFMGAGWSATLRNTMLLAFGLFLPLLLTLGWHFGNHGLWASLHIFLLARGVGLLVVLPGRRHRTFG